MCHCVLARSKIRGQIRVGVFDGVFVFARSLDGQAFKGGGRGAWSRCPALDGGVHARRGLDSSAIDVHNVIRHKLSVKCSANLPSAMKSP